MIKLKFHTLGAAAYEQERFDLILKTEGAKTAVYLDTVGHPTIGIGFDLMDANIRNKVLEAFEVTDTLAQEQIANIIVDTYPSVGAMQTALNAKMAELESQGLANRITFTFNNAGEMKAVFDEAVLIYDNSDTNIGPLGRVDNWLADIPQSKERAVLVSLSYNGVLGSNLKASVLKGDRAAAWYEIVFRSNAVIDGTSRRSLGVENRRLLEASTFSLYDPLDATTTDEAKLEEAKKIYRFLTDHYTDMQDYLHTVSHTDVAGQPTTEANFDTLWGEVQSQLNDARNTLVTDLNTTQALQLDANSYLSTDVYIDPGKSDDGAYNPDYHSSNITGSDRNDIILGEGGNDTLTGGIGNDVLVGGPDVLTEIGTDNDILDGGEGDDILIGGAGKDTLYSGTGTNWLYGGTGNDTYYITAEVGSTTIVEDTQGSDTYVIHGAPGATVNITDSDGVDTYRVYGGATVHINGANTDDSLSINGAKPFYLFQETAGQNVWKSEDGTITATHDSKNGNQQRMRMAA